MIIYRPNTIKVDQYNAGRRLQWGGAYDWTEAWRAQSDCSRAVFIGITNYKYHAAGVDGLARARHAASRSS